MSHPRLSVGDFVLFLSMHRAFYVACVVLLVALITRRQERWVWAGFFVALYVVKVVPEYLPHDAFFPTMVQGVVSMLLVWLLVAVLFASPKDWVMAALAAVVGAAQGALGGLMTDAGLASLTERFATDAFVFCSTALMLAYAIRRRPAADTLRSLPYATIAVAAGVVGALATMIAQRELNWIWMTDALALVNANRTVYVAGIALLVFRLTSTQAVWKGIVFGLALYALETIIDAAHTTEPAVVIVRAGCVMLIEWLFVAAVFLSPKDKAMILIAAATGVTQGVAGALHQAMLELGVLPALLANIWSYSTTALVLAYGIRRQRDDRLVVAIG